MGGYVFDVEVLCLAKGNVYRIEEIPIERRDTGDSRLNMAAMRQNVVELVGNLYRKPFSRGSAISCDVSLRVRLKRSVTSSATQTQWSILPEKIVM